MTHSRCLPTTWKTYASKMDVCMHRHTEHTHTHTQSQTVRDQFSTEITNLNCFQFVFYTLLVGTTSMYWCFWSYNNNTIIMNLFSVLMINRANTSETSRNRDDTFKVHTWKRNAKATTWTATTTAANTNGRRYQSVFANNILIIYIDYYHIYDQFRCGQPEAKRDRDHRVRA